MQIEGLRPPKIHENDEFQDIISSKSNKLANSTTELVHNTEGILSTGNDLYKWHFYKNMLKVNLIEKQNHHEFFDKNVILWTILPTKSK